MSEVEFIDGYGSSRHGNVGLLADIEKPVLPFDSGRYDLEVVGLPSPRLEREYGEIKAKTLGESSLAANNTLQPNGRGQACGTVDIYVEEVRGARCRQRAEDGAIVIGGPPKPDCRVAWKDWSGKAPLLNLADLGGCVQDVDLSVERQTRHNLRVNDIVIRGPRVACRGGQNHRERQEGVEESAHEHGFDASDGFPASWSDLCCPVETP